MERRAKIKERLTVIYQKLILDALEDKFIDEKEFRRFKKICNSRFKRNILIDQIIDIALIMPKDSLEKLRKLYFELGLIDETKKKLKSRHWHHKIKAMKELSHLDIKDYNKFIVKYINSNNDTLRMEAQIAMVRLSYDNNPFAFLTKLKHRFSLWEQITLHEQMIEANMSVPDFGEWLFSDNDDVVMFCLRMVREYNQRQNDDKITFLIMEHSNPKLRKLAIEVAGDLKLTRLTSILEFNYYEEEYENRLETIKSLGKIANLDSLKFLERVVGIDDDTQIQIESVKGIKNMGDAGKEFLNQMLDNDYRNYNIIIKHVLDNRIN
jgi:acyl carrier protein